VLGYRFRQANETSNVIRHSHRRAMARVRFGVGIWLLVLGAFLCYFGFWWGPSRARLGRAARAEVTSCLTAPFHEERKPVLALSKQYWL
jgi:hypothetical protein